MGKEKMSTKFANLILKSQKEILWPSQYDMFNMFHLNELKYVNQQTV